MKFDLSSFRLTKVRFQSRQKNTNTNLLNLFNQANCWIPTQQILDVTSTLEPFFGWSIEVKFSLIARLCFAFRIYFYRKLGGNGKTCPTSRHSCTCSTRTGPVGGYSVKNKTIRKGLTIRLPPTDSGRILCMRFHLYANHSCCEKCKMLDGILGPTVHSNVSVLQ